MTTLRWFIPEKEKGGEPRLQYKETFDIWLDVPVVYEDPGDEIIPCPRFVGEDHPEVDSDCVCAICFGEGDGRRADIKARLRALNPPGKYAEGPRKIKSVLELSECKNSWHKGPHLEVEACPDCGGLAFDLNADTAQHKKGKPSPCK